MRNYKKIFAGLSLLLLFNFFFLSCESEADRLGEQLFTKTALEDVSYDLVAYNIDNKDTIRADHQELGYAVLGAFSEGVFGGQVASYVSQIRLDEYSPNFGVNPVVDSAVLIIKPLYNEASFVETSKDEIFSDGNVEATKVVKTYPVHRYGKADVPNGGFTINVQEVSEYLGSSSEKSFSNRSVAVNPQVIGTAKFKGRVHQVKVNKKSDNALLYEQDASFRIPISKDFIQEKIVNKAGSAFLADAANFVRYFKGVRISVAENDGYLFRFSPSTVQAIVYYKHDQTSNGTTHKVRANFTMYLGNGNVHIGQYDYFRTDSSVASALASSNSVTGDSKLFLQGMGGPSAGIRIPESVVAQLKEKFKKNKQSILGASIRLYIDPLWNNEYEKPETFVFLQKDVNAFLPEITTLGALLNYSMIKIKDASTESPYYDIVITQTLKNIVELEAANKDFILSAGNWRINSANNNFYGYQYDSRAYALDRTVLVGTDANSNKRVQLHITYAK